MGWFDRSPQVERKLQKGDAPPFGKAPAKTGANGKTPNAAPAAPAPNQTPANADGSWGAGQGYQPEDQAAHDEAHTNMSAAMDGADEARQGVSSQMMQLQSATKALNGAIAVAEQELTKMNGIRSKYGDEDMKAPPGLDQAKGMANSLGQFHDVAHSFTKAAGE